MARSKQSKDESATLSPARTALIIVGLLLFIIAWYALVNAGNSTDQSSKKDETSEQQKQEPKPEEKPQDTNAAAEAANQARAAANRGDVSDTYASDDEESYRYVAGSGESYTGLARRSITATDSGLSPVERVAAETKLTQDAAARLLNAGEEVTLKKSGVEAAIAWAKSLSAEQKAAWQPYADAVAW